MREIVPFVLLACACGAAAWSGRTGGPVAPEEGRSVETTTDPGGTGASGADAGFGALETLGAGLAPGMRRVAERENAGERVELLKAVDRDACFRVAFEATAPVTARLTDAQGAAVATTRAPAAQGALPDQGPFCIRKGDAVSGTVDGTAVRVRSIVWAAP